MIYAILFFVFPAIICMIIIFILADNDTLPNILSVVVIALPLLWISFSAIFIDVGKKCTYYPVQYNEGKITEAEVSNYSLEVCKRRSYFDLEKIVVYRLRYAGKIVASGKKEDMFNYFEPNKEAVLVETNDIEELNTKN